MRIRSITAGGIGLILAGCSLVTGEFDFSEGVDASVDASIDGGTSDSGSIDAGSLDAGDASALDSGIGDGGDDSGPLDSCVPADEVCDGLDNDCDGDTDEGSASELGCAWSCVAGSCADPVMPSAGDRSTCTLLGDGTVACWGGNSLGQLGDGTTSDRARARVVPGVGSVSQLATGSDFTCVLDEDADSVRCWGANNVGQLGTGVSGDSSSEPTELVLAGGTPSDIRAISTGGVSDEVRQFTGEDTLAACVIAGAERRVFCWGSTTGYEVSPVPSTGEAVELTVGGGYACQRASLDRPRCFGNAQIAAGLGDGSTNMSETPVRNAIEGVATEVVAGRSHACAVIGGTVYCWGRNYGGSIGQEEVTAFPTPLAVSGTGSVIQLALGDRHTCGLRDDGTVVCWGTNDSGELGDGTSTSSHTPTLVMGLSEVERIAAGRNHSCAVVSSGEMYCWGSNDFGQLGDGTTTRRLSPVLVLPPE